MPLPEPPETLFDPLADGYETMRQEVGWEPMPHVDAALPEDLSGLRVLDVGCGTGEVARALIARGARVIGVDASERMCTLAAERTPGGLFIQAHLGPHTGALPFADASFDAVIALGCVEYVEDIEGACTELVRVARPGAWVLYAIELCGEGFAGGDARSVPMFGDWRRHRRPEWAVTRTAQALLDGPQIEVVPAYLLEEEDALLMYARVMGRRR